MAVCEKRRQEHWARKSTTTVPSKFVGGWMADWGSKSKSNEAKEPPMKPLLFVKYSPNVISIFAAALLGLSMGSLLITGSRSALAALVCKHLEYRAKSSQHFHQLRSVGLVD